MFSGMLKQPLSSRPTRLCIDLDGVICALRKPHEKYENLKPIPGAVKALQDLKKSGAYIIINTARNMKTQEANLGRVQANIGLITLAWLQKHKVPYDEIYFGKPWADVYIDDNALEFSSWNQTKAKLKKKRL